MRLRLLKGALLVGAVLGFSSGAASMAWRLHRHHDRQMAWQEAAWERRASSACGQGDSLRGAGRDGPGWDRPGFGPGHWAR